jgi:hypothetical protein
LVIRNGAKLATIGSLEADPFDGLDLKHLQRLDYSLASIDMSDGSPNLQEKFAFAIKTNLGHYVKARIAEVITRTVPGGTEKDLGLELFVYR